MTDALLGTIRADPTPHIPWRPQSTAWAEDTQRPAPSHAGASATAA